MVEFTTLPRALLDPCRDNLKSKEGRLLAGRFLLNEKPIGEGAMAYVYPARDIQENQTVAVKMHKGPIKDEPKKREGLSIEAKALGLIKHSGVPSLIFCPEDYNRYYFVMEYVDGESLEKLLRGRAGKPKEVLLLAMHICDILSAIHEKGIVHRDVKPENIVVSDIDSSDVHLIDFSIAKGPWSDDEELGRTCGTPPYMAPEQINGLSDHRADLYSLGIVIYEAIAGVRPFVAGDIVSVFLMHLFDKPMPLHERLPSIPQSISELVGKSLEKKPMDRYQSALEFREAIKACLDELK